MTIPIKSSLTLLLLLLLLFSSQVSSNPDSDSTLVAELLHLQSQSPSGVIHLTDQLLTRFLAPSTSRPYSLLIFFDALHLHDNSDLRLKELRREFALLASAFISHNQHNPDRTKLFFFDIEFAESQQSFHLFDVNALPHVRLITPNVTNLRNSVPMDQGAFARHAESMAEFVESKTSLFVGPIERPPVLSRSQLGFLVLALLASAPFLIKRVVAGNTILHDHKLWLSLSVFVYFFSVSGMMHNIIRNAPMVLTDRADPSQLVFFYQGSGMQLGAEGFVVGFLYTIVGLLLAFVSHVLVYSKDKMLQRVIMVFTLFVSFWAVKKVVYLDNWKTGYSIHGYVPSNWK